MGFFSKNSTTNAAGCCQACGAPLEPDCAFCTACGAPVTAPSAPPMGGGFGTAGVCPVCGAPLEPDCAFCTSCGTPVSASPAPSPAPSYEDTTILNQNTCPGCGAVLEPDAAFCTSCGYNLSGSAPVAPPVPEEEPKPSFKVCPNCNSHVEADAAFCPNCSAVLDQNLDRCPRCGGIINAGFCSVCGYRVGEESAAHSDISGKSAESQTESGKLVNRVELRPDPRPVSPAVEQAKRNFKSPSDFDV